MEKCKNLRNDFKENLCIECGKTLNTDWNFCPYCTINIEAETCSCGKVLNETWKFCPYCKRAVSNPSNAVQEDGNEWLSKILNPK